MEANGAKTRKQRVNPKRKPGTASGGQARIVITDPRAKGEPMLEDEPARFFTPKQLAQYLSLSDRQVRRLIHDRVIPSYRVGGARRIDRGEVEAYLRGRRDG